MGVPWLWLLYVAVCNDGCNKGCQNDEQSKVEDQHFNWAGVRTGEMDQGAEVTEEVRDDMGATEG